MAKISAPQNNELELSLFGPGIGECLVIHLGAGKWIVVDSCLNATGDKSVALEYLEQLAVDLASQVKLIVVTHWHDDHIRGIAQVLRLCTSARFACSAALRSEEFCQLLAAGEEIKLVEHTSGIRELAEVMEILQQRTGGRFVAGPDYWACEGMLLFSESHPHEVEVHSLSPSSQTISDSKGEIARLIPSIGGAIRRFPSVTPNDLSVVLLVKTRGLQLLLGADLERGRDHRRGWQAVIASLLRPRVSSSAYKVAHHGSENADFPAIWTDLLVKNSHAVLTPYARGRKPLPSNSDVRRITSRTDHAYCTVWPPTNRPPRRRNVDRTMNETTRDRRAVWQRPGHIRLRVPFSGNLDDITVELFDGAAQLRRANSRA